MKCFITLPSHFSSVLLLLLFTALKIFSLLAQTEDAKRSGNISLLFFHVFKHDHWPYKMQLVGSDYMLVIH